jgi:cation:H+ antiporter
MVLAVMLLLGGAAVLTVGAEAAIRGAGRLAEARRISPFVLGAVLFGVDIESVGAALIAAGRGQTSIAAGEAFGTVVFLFSAAFGVALILARRPVESPPVGMVLLPGATIVVGAAALSDHVVSRVDGLLLILVYGGYLAMVLRQRRPAEERGKEIVREAQEGPSIPPMVLLVAGLALIYGGAAVLVEGGTRVLARTSLAAGFVGGALIGTLASLDEVLLEVLPILRGLPELATGNLFGTVAAFTTGVLGLAALVRPLEVDWAGASAFLAAALLYAVVSTAFLLRGRVWRGVGVTTILVYALWLAYAVRL